jgi:hypothetical protein
MPVEVRGPTFAEYAERFEALDPKDIAEVLAEETIALVQDAFLNETSPDGDPWAALTIRNGAILRDTGAMFAAWGSEDLSASGFTVVNGRDYVDYHQKGTGVHGPKGVRLEPLKGAVFRIPGLGFRASTAGTPARKMVPEGDLPDPWALRYESAVSEYMQGLLDP